MTWWERAYLFEIIRGLLITGGVFLRNMGKWMTGRKGALTTYYPEETRSDYAAGNRGKHILTQRPDGSPQCIACNMCATVCPAQVIEIDAAFDPNDPAHPKYPSRFEIDYSRCIFCGLCIEACPEDAIRMVKETPGLPTTGDRDHMWLNLTELITGTRRATSRSPIRRAMRRPFPRASRHGSRVPRRAILVQARAHAMINSLLAHLDTALIYVFALSAFIGAALMLVLRHPMQVAMALISTMVFLGGIYGLLGVHFIAAFQVLIYVSAVMVFMVYVIMLLDVRDVSFTHRFSRWLFPGMAFGTLLFAALGYGLVLGVDRLATTSPSFGLAQFAAAFLSEYWLQFELTSVLLVAAVVAALAVIKGSRRRDRG